MELKRSLNTFDSISVLFSSMVGSGIFFTSGYLIKETGNLWIVLFCWIVGGILALSGSITYAYAARLLPFAGGDYVYLKVAYSPAIAFMSGWSSLLTNFSACVSVLALAFGKYVQILFPELPVWESPTYTLLGLDLQVSSITFIGVLPILFFSILNYFGIKSAVRVQNVFAVLKITGLLLFLALGFSMGNTNWSYLFNSHFPNLMELSFYSKVLIGIVPVSFSYLGWNMITYIAEEVKNPEKTIVRSAITACFLVAGLYFAINLLFVISAPIGELAGQDGIGAIAFQKLFGVNYSILTTSFIAWVILGSMSAILIGGSRVYFAMARDGVFLPSFSKVHPKWHSPYVSIFFQGFVAILFLFVKEIEALLYMITCSILILSCLTAATPFRFEKMGMKSDYKIPFYPLPIFLYIFANIAVMAILFIEKPVTATWGLMITLIALPVYYGFRLDKKMDKAKK
ncbi:APC family permease [Leptospira mtsangambouensis]|uniref:APC family permease n=1 Tax=Leptospira mtsangambouensis TaxID=2484912 RepID=UPI001EEC6D01|nr:amino acid permease [Leptospira mtsangambouensis]MCG6139191.1 amino acid permease [Leptospira mtsangambouensis]